MHSCSAEWLVSQCSYPRTAHGLAPKIDIKCVTTSALSVRKVKSVPGRAAAYGKASSREASEPRGLRAMLRGKVWDSEGPGGEQLLLQVRKNEEGMSMLTCWWDGSSR